MKSAIAFVVVACLLVVFVQGQRTSVQRCLCQGPGMKMVRLKRIEKIEVFPPSPTCDRMEIIVTLKNGAGKKCLDPESDFARNYIKKALKKRSAQ